MRMNVKHVVYGCIVAGVGAVLLAGCQGKPNSGQGVACANGLRAANGELQRAKVAGLGGSVAWSKAASLLTAAKVQQQFDKYPNCLDKVKRARYYIRQARIKD